MIISKYSFIYTSPFARCIDTSIVMATALNIVREQRRLPPIHLRIDYGLREMSIIPLRTLMDDEMEIGAIVMRYRNHIPLLDTMYESDDTFEDVQVSSLNLLTEVYRPLDAIERIYTADKYSIICTHGLNLASIHLKFPTGRLKHINGGDLCRGNSLSSYCYSLRFD